MKHQNIIYWINKTGVNSWQENRTLSMINQMEVMMQEVKLSIIKKV